MKYKILNDVEIEIDEDDLQKINQTSWALNKSTGYISGYFRNADIKKVYLHRFLMNADIYQEVNHIDRDKFNFKKSNLRFVTRSQNLFNRKHYKDTVGVSYHSRDKKWQAYIGCRPYTHLGYFNTEEEALEARKQAEIKYAERFGINRTP